MGSNNKKADFERPGVVAAAMSVGTSALMVLGVQPILLGGLIAEGRMEDAALGKVAMAEVFSLAVGACIGPFLMSGGRMRLKSALCSLMLAAVNLAMPWASSESGILALRTAAGLLGGVSFGAAVVVFAYSSRPERLSGIFLGVQTIPQIIAGLLLPTAVIPRFGVQGGFALLSGLAIVAALASVALVDRVVRPPAAKGMGPRWSPALTLFVAAVLLQNAGIGAAWSYLERLATQHGFSTSIVGASVAGSLGFQILGAWCAAWLGWRLPSRVMLVSGALTQAVVVFALSSVGSGGAFTVAACAFGLFWLALQPFLITLAIELEPTRSVAVLLTPISLVGFSIGALVVSFFLPQGDILPAYVGSSLFLCAAGLAFAGTAYGCGGRRSVNALD